MNKHKILSNCFHSGKRHGTKNLLAVAFKQFLTFHISYSVARFQIDNFLLYCSVLLTIHELFSSVTLRFFSFIHHSIPTLHGSWQGRNIIHKVIRMIQWIIEVVTSALSFVCIILRPLIASRTLRVDICL